MNRRAMMSAVKTRFAPSPTGPLHIGGVRTALFAYLYARRRKGQFLLRIEDTDRQRSSESAASDILDTLSWLGLEYDEPPCYQSRRSSLYQQALEQLLAAGHAYYCHCSSEQLQQMRDQARRKGEKPRYNRHCRDRGLGPEPGPSGAPVIRFRNPDDGELCIADRVQGQVRYHNRELDDLVLARADGSVTYHLTVVVDDHRMGITDVIRGDDHLNNTPRQINIFRALGLSWPHYAHLPMILDAEGRKLSKRSGAASALYYREQGYLPEAVLNYLLRLGWSCGDEELFSRQEMVERFDLQAVHRSPGRLNPGKLAWLNRHYLSQADNSCLARELQRYFARDGQSVEAGPSLENLVEVQKKRAETLHDIYEQSLCFYSDFKEYDPRAARRALRPRCLPALLDLQTRLQEQNPWQAPGLLDCVRNCAAQHDLKFAQLAQAVRVAGTGGMVSPGIGDTLFLLGRKRSLARLGRAIAFLQEG